MIAKSVYRSLAGLSTKPAARRNLFTIPLLPSMFIHAKLLITELVIMGKMDNASSSPLYFLGQRLIKYAVGIPPAIQKAVVITAILTVRRNIFI